jgi:hypothetical protein
MIRLPISMYAEWRKMNRGVRVYFRGPRRSRASDTLKSDATHFVFY